MAVWDIDGWDTDFIDTLEIDEPQPGIYYRRQIWKGSKIKRFSTSHLMNILNFLDEHDFDIGIVEEWNTIIKKELDYRERNWTPLEQVLERKIVI